MIRRITEIIPRPERDFVYDVLAKLPRIRLCVDVGAAAGQATLRMRLAGGPKLAVVAFEPFPANVQFFERETRDLANVKLIRKAVGGKVGTAKFLVPQVVQGTERNWESFTGYSSTGFLIDWPTVLDWARDFRRSLRIGTKIALGRFSPKGCRLTVDTTTLDAEFAGKRIDFLKIDVQGGEEKVLLGAANLLKTGAIPRIYLEWTGQRSVVEMLEKHSFIIFDSVYLIFPRGAPLSKFEQLGLEHIADVSLSSGQPAYEMILNGGTLSPSDVVRHAREVGLAGIQTDLIAIHESCLAEFIGALKSMSPARTEAFA